MNEVNLAHPMSFGASLRAGPLVRKAAQALGAVAILIPLIGCNMDSQIVKDMEAAYQQKQQQESNVSEVVRKYFPSGMNLQEALKQLQEFGFEITEFKGDGFRKWPDGKLRAYNNEAHRKSAGVTEGKINYTARQRYDYHLIVRLMGKRAVVVIESDGRQVLKSEGHVYLEGM